MFDRSKMFNANWSNIDQDVYQHVSGYTVYPAEFGGCWTVSHPSSNEEVVFPTLQSAVDAVGLGSPALPANLGGTWIN